MDENTKWIKKKQPIQKKDEGFESKPTEKNTSSAEIRAIEEKINQAKKHFTKLPLFESLYKEGFEGELSEEKIAEEKAKFVDISKQNDEQINDFNKKIKEIIEQIKKYSDPETILDNSLKTLGVSDEPIRVMIKQYILCMCYFCIVIMATYNIYGITEDGSKLPEWMNKSYDFVVNSLSFFKFTNNYGLMPLMLFAGYKRFLISFVISAICTMMIMNPASLVILILEAISGGEWYHQLWRAPLVPIIFIWSIGAAITSLADLSKMAALFFSPITFIATSIISFIMMIVFTPISAFLFSLYWTKNLIFPTGFLKSGEIDKYIDENDIKTETTDEKKKTMSDTGIIEKIKEAASLILNNILSKHDPNKITKGGNSLPETITKEGNPSNFMKNVGITDMAGAVGANQMASKLGANQLADITGAMGANPITDMTNKLTGEMTGMMANQMTGMMANQVPGASLLFGALGIKQPDTKFDIFLKYLYSFLFIIFWVIIHIYALKGRNNPILTYVPPAIVIPIWVVYKYVKQIRKMFGIKD